MCKSESTDVSEGGRERNFSQIVKFEKSLAINLNDAFADYEFFYCAWAMFGDDGCDEDVNILLRDGVRMDWGDGKSAGNAIVNCVDFHT